MTQQRARRRVALPRNIVSYVRRHQAGAHRCRARFSYVEDPIAGAVLGSMVEVEAAAGVEADRRPPATARERFATVLLVA